MTKQMQTERDFALRVRRKLNVSASQIDNRVLDRLFEARQNALAAHTQVESRLFPAFVGRSLAVWRGEKLRPFALATVLVLALASGNYAMDLLQISELEEIDSALLADDLPINAYLDNGFDSWLTDSSER